MKRFIFATVLFASCTTPAPTPAPSPTPAPEVVPVIKTGTMTLLFDFNKSVVKKDQAEAAIKALNAERKKDTVVQVSGFADVRGTDEYNMVLSQHRAEAVVKYLTKLGVNTSNLKADWFGESVLADAGHTEAAHAKNRRVEVTYQKP